MTTETQSDRPEAQIETIVVDADEIIETMRRNDRDQDQQRTHVLRVSPPFEGEKRAKPHVSDPHAHYPPEMDPKPLHISPEGFIVGHTAGSRHADWQNEWNFPDYNMERSLFRDEYDIRDEDGKYRDLTDEEEEEWEEWWETAVGVWEELVRQALENSEELTISSQHPDVKDAVVSVRVEE